MNRCILLSVLLMIFSCDVQDEIINSKSKPNNNIEIGRLSEVNIDSLLIDSMRTVLDLDSFPTVHSVLIVRNNKLVFEQYYKNYDKDQRHDLRSAGKSIANIIMGVAVKNGLIKDENEYVLDVLPFKNIKNNSSMKQRMQIKHVMSMTDGLQCGDCVTAFQNQNEPIEYLIGLPMAHEPGDTWFYNDATPSLVEYMVLSKAQMSLIEFMDQFIYGPLNIEIPSNFDINYLRPRDMAQLGMLYLNGGAWNGKQIVTSDWVAKSTTKQVSNVAYGYFWWVFNLTDKENRVFSCYAARGNGDNDIIVVPNKNLVCVFTGENFDAVNSFSFELMKNYILAAIND